MQEFSPKITKQNNILYIWDIIRKKNIQLTPEEWVRQKLIHWLIAEKNYPKGLFRVEKGLKYIEKNKRTDILVLDTAGEPFLLVECKAQNVELDMDAFQQLLTYHLVYPSPYLALFNENKIKIWHFDKENSIYTEILGIPDFR